MRRARPNKSRVAVERVKFSVKDVRWTNRANIMVLECAACGRRHEHRVDRRRVFCVCGVTDDLFVLRRQWAGEDA